MVQQESDDLGTLFSIIGIEGSDQWSVTSEFVDTEALRKDEVELDTSIEQPLDLLTRATVDCIRNEAWLQVVGAAPGMKDQG
ncbi:MAG: hypothetical protein GX595_16005 [Lentisphaerae bacterium]|nr:hypothetical protein [Lentisphaerota bacterium]